METLIEKVTKATATVISHPDCPTPYRTIKESYLNKLAQASPLTLKNDYWKNIDFGFLAHNWKLTTRENQGKEEKNYQKFISSYRSLPGTTDIFIINGKIQSLNTAPHPTLLVSVVNTYPALAELKGSFEKSFRDPLILKNWLLYVNELMNDEVLRIQVTESKIADEQPATLRIIHLTDNSQHEFIACPQVYVEMANNSKLNIIEEHMSNENHRSFKNQSIKLCIHKGAEVNHLLFQNDSPQSIHVNHTAAKVAEGANYRSFVFQKGSAEAIVQKSVDLEGNASNCELYGLSQVNGEQKMNNLTLLTHNAPNATSNQDYRGILEGRGSLNFMGQITVASGASGTDSAQLNQNLILSKESKLTTRPRLEIFNDNVKCAHGATSREVNEEELFYLQSRGLPLDHAKNLLIQAFAQGFFNLVTPTFSNWTFD